MGNQYRPRESESWDGCFAPITGLFRDHPRRLALLAATTVPHVFALSAATAFVSKHFQENQGLSPGSVAVLYFIGGSVSCFGYLASAMVADKIGRRRLLLAAISATAFFYAVLYLTDNVPLAVVVCKMGLFCFFSADMALAMIATELFPTAQRATAAAARLVIVVIAQAAGLATESLIFRLGRIARGRDRDHAGGRAAVAAELMGAARNRTYAADEISAERQT